MNVIMAILLDRGTIAPFIALFDESRCDPAHIGRRLGAPRRNNPPRRRIGRETDFGARAMLKPIAKMTLAALLVVSPLAVLPSTGSATAATYKNDYIPKRSDSFRHHIGHMENESKQRARAGAQYMRQHHLSLF
jgi:hypothetical protein